MAELKKDNVAVIGVSFDSAESHLRFIAKYKLNFPLLADADGKIAHVTDTPSADTHLSEMKEAVKNLTRHWPRIKAAGEPKKRKLGD